MKRDWDVVREILLQIEAIPSSFGDLDSQKVRGVDPDVAAYHMETLYEAGLIKGISSKTTTSNGFMANRMTWEGHEFLDSIRDKSTWDAVKGTAAEKGASLSFEVIKALAIAYVKSKLSL